MKKELEKQFEQIFWEHKDMVYFTAIKYLKKSEEAEEIVQEVFLKVYLNLHKFENRSSLKTWIYRIALNEIFGHFKKKKKDRVLIELPENIEHEDGVLEEMELKELKHKFHELLKKQPEKRAKIIFLRLVEALSFRDIGEIMGTSEDSAKNLFSIGIRNIKKDLEVYYGR